MFVIGRLGVSKRARAGAGSKLGVRAPLNHYIFYYSIPRATWVEAGFESHSSFNFIAALSSEQNSNDYLICLIKFTLQYNQHVMNTSPSLIITSFGFPFSIIFKHISPLTM